MAKVNFSKSAQLSAVAAAMMLGLSGIANAAVIDFDHTAAQAGTNVGDYYKNDYGIVFTQAYFNNDPSGYLWISGEADTATMNGVLNQPIAGFFFGGVTDNLSALIKFPDVGTVTTLEVYDSFNNLIGSASNSPGGLSISITAVGISSFRFSWSNSVFPSTSDNIIGIDQLGFNTLVPPPVPEPEIYAMMGLGFGLLGWVRRHRKRQATA